MRRFRAFAVLVSLLALFFSRMRMSLVFVFYFRAFCWARRDRADFVFAFWSPDCVIHRSLFPINRLCSRGAREKSRRMRNMARRHNAFRNLSRLLGGRSGRGRPGSKYTRYGVYTVTPATGGIVGPHLDARRLSNSVSPSIHTCVDGR